MEIAGMWYLSKKFISSANRDRMHVILYGKQLQDVDCFKYLGSQVAADGGCERDVELGERWKVS